MKHIIFGGFDYAILYEMDQNAILNGVDYFIDIDSKWIGKTYLGKKIKSIESLREEDRDDILILIGSIVYRAELEYILKKMGFRENIHYKWAIAFNGDMECPRLWKHVEWSDESNNAYNLRAQGENEYYSSRLKVVANMIDWNVITNVIDLGAAYEQLNRFIPTEVQYIPIDYIKYTSNTLVIDLNKHQFLDSKENLEWEHTCVIAIGTLGYCEDWKWLLKKMTEYGQYVIVGHDDFARVSREYRRTHWTRYNALFDHEIIRYMQELNYLLKDSTDFRLKTSLLSFTNKG